MPALANSLPQLIHCFSFPLLPSLENITLFLLAHEVKANTLHQN